MALQFTALASLLVVQAAAQLTADMPGLDETILNGETCPEGATGIRLEFVARYESGTYDEGATESATYDPTLQHVFFTNADSSTVMALDLSDLANSGVPQEATPLPTPETHTPNSVTAYNGTVAVALSIVTERDGLIIQEPGAVGFYELQDGNWTEVALYNFNDTDIQEAFIAKSGTPYGYAGCLPDMVKFTPDGTQVLVAIEGEATYDDNEDVEEYSTTEKNPEGAIVIITIGEDMPEYVTFKGVNLTSAKENGGIFMTERYTDGQEYGDQIDIEPEFIAISDDSTTAYVTLQENNALAIVDIDGGTVTAVLGLGYKSAAEWALDIGDNGIIEIEQYPGIQTLYQPDSIVYKTIGGKGYLFTANEGDDRDGESVDAYTLVPQFSDALKQELGAEVLSKLEEGGEFSGYMVHPGACSDDVCDKLTGYGGRSFAIWEAESGALVYDSGDEFEFMVADAIENGTLPGAAHNADKTEARLDARSDKKGPETEAIDVLQVGDRYYAIAGAETTSVLYVYDVTVPEQAEFVQMIAHRKFVEDPENAETEGLADFEAGSDLGPEYVVAIAAEDSPIEEPLVLVSNEVSGTLSVYKVYDCEAGMMGPTAGPASGPLDDITRETGNDGHALAGLLTTALLGLLVLAAL